MIPNECITNCSIDSLRPTQKFALNLIKQPIWANFFHMLTISIQAGSVVTNSSQNFVLSIYAASP